ncbi:hypothetical protein SAMN05421644_14423 [Allochromatium warmingii]|uniref:Uncharacterized protein n=1 Tax=Allochromatium warmingii TaxID=61595 RepID=A0A1H3ILL1_ALLWA|nr:hypothetical protein [Allochromatium warmingii]SDY27714.1 hypothetical protein SAMN05421644_14423 [Allochromatium warmingii]
MQERPIIKTAIPKRRYQIERYAASLLGEIESGDGRNYRYLLAFIMQGQTEPVLYVCSEPTPLAERAAGAYCLRVVSESLTETLDINNAWGDLDHFAEQALQVGAQLLGLPESSVMRLL